MPSVGKILGGVGTAALLPTPGGSMWCQSAGGRLDQRNQATFKETISSERVQASSAAFASGFTTHAWVDRDDWSLHVRANDTRRYRIDSALAVTPLDELPSLMDAMLPKIDTEELLHPSYLRGKHPKKAAVKPAVAKPKLDLATDGTDLILMSEISLRGGGLMLAPGNTDRPASRAKLGGHELWFDYDNAHRAYIGRDGQRAGREQFFLEPAFIVDRDAHAPIVLDDPPSAVILHHDSLAGAGSYLWSRVDADGRVLWKATSVRSAGDEYLTAQRVGDLLVVVTREHVIGIDAARGTIRYDVTP